MPLALILLGLGYLLVDAAVRDQHPWCEVLRAFGGSCPPAPGVSPGQAESIQPGPQGTGPIQGPPPAPGSTITDRAAAFYEAVFARFPSAGSAGVFACRTIKPHNGGTSETWSEHAWGNALDVSGSAATMAKVMVWANLRRRRFGIRNIIGPGTSIQVVHVDFLPSHAGQTPPCA